MSTVVICPSCGVELERYDEPGPYLEVEAQGPCPVCGVDPERLPEIDPDTLLGG